MPRRTSAQCAKCGSTFTPMSATNRYCSSSCQQTRRRARTERACPVCLREFRPAGYHQSHCSMECATKACHIGESCAIAVHRCHCGAWYVKHHLLGWHCFGLPTRQPGLRLKPKTISACETCGRTMVIAGKGMRRYCTDDCRRASKTHRERKRRDKDNRAMRKRGAFVEQVQRTKVYERDGWVCQLCRKPVRRDKVVPHPLAPTLDHIVPLAGGGAHAYANVQLAHFMCNSAKSDRDAQLRWDVLVA